MPADCRPDEEDDDDAGPKRKIILAAGPRKKKKASEKPKPLALKKTKVPDTANPAIAQRSRNATKKEDDEQLRLYNITTINIGALEKHLNTQLKNPQFQRSMEKSLIAWQLESNRIRIAVNIALRKLFVSMPDLEDLSIASISQSMGHSKISKTLIELVSQISPHPHYLNRLQAKSYPSEVYSQLVHDLVSNLKTLQVNGFMKALVIFVQRKLDELFDGNVGSGIAKLVSAFLMGRRGKITRQADEEESIDDDADVLPFDIDEESLDSLEALVRLLGNRLKKCKSTFDKAAISSLLNSLRGKPNLDSLRALYLPAYLLPLVGQWKKKVSAKSYGNAGLIWKLFHTVNTTAFAQHLFPTPSTKGRYSKITTTMLASIFTSYITQYNPQIPLPLPLKLNKTLKYWNSKPAELWNLVFPGILLHCLM